MASLRRPITSLLNGVSQEAPSLRLPSQCEAQVNGYSSLSDGLVKRPAAQHLSKLSGTAHATAHVTTLNYSSTEQFIVVIIPGDLFVYDTAGVSKTVTFPHGKTYLASMSSTDCATAAVEDETYIINKTFTVTMDGVTNAGGTYQGELQDTAALMAVAGPTNGDVYRIVGDGTIKAQGYYMKWNGTTTVWEESAYPGDPIRLLDTTMPHKLVYNSGAGTFTFQKETWADRLAGDAVLTPTPSFVNRELSDIFFWRNRLGVLAGEYVTLSESGPNYTNFWGKTATTLLDNDRIDARAANVKVSKLKSAVPFNRQLALQSESNQFIMSTAVGQVLTPNTASLDVSTTYSANADAKPVTSGNSLFFASEDSGYVTVREYSVSSDSEIVNVATNITSQIPKYIKNSVYRMEMAEDIDTLFLLHSNASERNRIFVHKFYEDNGEKLQSSWSHWKLPTGTNILNMGVLEDWLYIVAVRIDGTHFLRINLSDDPSVDDLGFPCLLDFRVELAGVYDGANDWTTWTLPYVNTAMTLQVIQSGGFTGGAGAIVQTIVYPTNTTVRADGDLTADDVYIGVPYEFLYQFSEQFVRKDQNNEQGSPILHGELHLRNMAVRYSDTGYVRAEVVPRVGADTYTYIFSGKVLGSTSLIIGEPNIETGTFKFPIVGRSQNVTITLINDTHVPCKLISAEWTGNFTSRREV